LPALPADFVFISHAIDARQLADTPLASHDSPADAYFHGQRYFLGQLPLIAFNTVAGRCFRASYAAIAATAN
jgi:hypothetical protein